MGGRISVCFYLAIVQDFLIFSTDTWAVTPHIGRMLWGFRHRVAWRIPGKHPWLQEDGTCEYPRWRRLYGW